MISIIPKDARPCNNTFIVNVTPEMAKGWLEANNFNRPKRPEEVAKYVRQIRDGRWKLTHQGLAFSQNGIILDGQHRLFAIIDSGATLPMRICINESLDNFAVIDCGKNRSHLDVIRMSERDSTITTAHTTTVKAMLAGRFCKTVNRWTNAELKELYDPHADPVKFTVAQFHHCKDRQINDPTVRGVIARAHYHVVEDSLELFCSILQYGGTHKGCSVVNSLTNSLKSWNNRTEGTRQEIYKRTELTLEAFLGGASTVNFGKDINELFPLPQERR